MTKPNDELEKPSRLIFLFTMIAILSVFAIAKSIGITYFENNDILNWVSLVIEIGAASGITVFVWKYTKYEQSKTTKLIVDMKKVMEKLDNLTNEQKIQAELKEKSEHQHCKERLTYELSILVFRVDLAISQYNKNDEKAHMLENISHAKINLNGLQQINSIFHIPTQIRSQCNDLLSHYHAIIENIEHECVFEQRTENIGTDLANHVKKFLEDEFFSENNNEIITKQLVSLENQLSRISSRRKKC